MTDSVIIPLIFLLSYKDMKNFANMVAIKAFRPKPLTEQTCATLGKILNNFTLQKTHLVYRYEFPSNRYLQTL
jgi:hypothetical protein